jgi:hypothetical protein
LCIYYYYLSQRNKMETGGRSKRRNRRTEII